MESYWTEEDESGLWAMSYKESAVGNRFKLYLNAMYENYLIDPVEATIEGDFLVSAMVKPNIKFAYSIGLGFGLEPYELLRLPEIERFDTAEISPGVIVLAKRAWSVVGGGPSPYFYLLGFKNGIPPRYEEQVMRSFLRAPGLFETTQIKSPTALFAHLLIPRREEIMKLNVEMITDDLPVVGYNYSLADAKKWDDLREIVQPFSSERLATYIEGTAFYIVHSED
jgi:hypothetical protein